MKTTPGYRAVGAATANLVEWDTCTPKATQRGLGLSSRHSKSYICYSFHLQRKAFLSCWANKKQNWTGKAERSTFLHINNDSEGAFESSAS